VIGDVRSLPFEVELDGQRFRPNIALWLNAQNGAPFAQLIDPPGQPARTLLDALLDRENYVNPDQPAGLPGRVVTFQDDIATDLKKALEPQGVQVLVSPPVPQFDELFNALADHLKAEIAGMERLDLPDDVLRRFVAAANELWRAKPWTYLADYPPFGLTPRGSGARPLYVSVLGNAGELFGLAVYQQLEDYERMLAFGEALLQIPAATTAEEAVDAIGLQGREVILGFDPKEDLLTSYRDQLASAGWSRRLSVVPTVAGWGGPRSPDDVSVAEVEELCLAAEAITAFARGHRAELAAEDFPVRGKVEVKVGNQTVVVDVAAPPDASAPGREARA
jgi:hypothetical protein